MNRFCLVPLIFMALNTNVYAQTPAMGVGTFTCGKFASLYRESPDVAENIFVSWAQGFMSAINLETSTTGPAETRGYHDLSDTPLLKARLREYCNKQPLAPYMNAVVDVMGKLPIKPYRPQ